MSFDNILNIIDEEINDEDTELQSVDTNDETDTEEVKEKSILKPKPKRGRKPLTVKQKKALEKGRQNHQLRMARKKIEEIEQQREQEEEPKPIPKRKPTKKKTYVYKDDSSESEDEVVIVKKKKKRKPKKKIIYESDSSDDDSDSMEPPQPIYRQPPQQPPQPTYRRGIFR